MNYWYFVLFSNLPIISWPLEESPDSCNQMFSAIHEHRWISVNINTKCVAFLNQQRLVVELMSQQWIHFWLYMLYSYPEFIYLEMFKDIDVLFALGQHAYFHFYSVNSQDQQFVIDMSPKSDTLSRFRGSQSLLLFLVAAWYNLQTPKYPTPFAAP